MVSSLPNQNAELLLEVFGMVREVIMPLESFPAHICDDLTFRTLDTCIDIGSPEAMFKAKELLDQLNLDSESARLAKFKFKLASSNSKPTDIIQEFVECLPSLNSMDTIISMIRKVKREDLLKKCLSAVARSNRRLLKDVIQGELSEHLLNLYLAAGDLDNVQKEVEEYMRFYSETSRSSVIYQLVQAAEAKYLQKDMSVALDYFQLASSLCVKDSEIERTNLSIIQRKTIMIQLELGMTDAAEEGILGLPFDIHGLSMRFYLAVELGNSSDAVQFLNGVVEQQATDQILLGMANWCTSRKAYGVLLQVLNHLLRLDLKESLKKEVLKSAVSAAMLVGASEGSEARVSLLLEFIEQAIPMLLKDDSEVVFYFKLAWNGAVEANRAGSGALACKCFYKAYRILKLGTFQPNVHLSQSKVMCILGCLSELVALSEDEFPLIWQEKARLVAEAHDLYEDVEITSAYIPPSNKRHKANGAVFDCSIPFDPINTARRLTMLKFQVLALNAEWAECEVVLESSKSSSDTETLQELALWCTKKRNTLPPRLVIKVVQQLAEHLLQADSGSDLLKFSFVYRGLTALALALSHSDALAYFQQGLALIKKQPGYPKEEVCWLAVASYNHALSLTRLDADAARAWCELSMALCHHAGPFRSQYEQTIRSGYSRILQRLSSSR